MKVKQAYIENEFLNKDSASLTEIAEQFCKTYGGDKQTVTINLFRRLWRGEFDFYYTDYNYTNALDFHYVKTTKTAITINGETLNWLGTDFRRYFDLLNGVRIALKEICIERCISGKSIDIDYSTLLSKELETQKPLSKDDDAPGTISAKHAEIILEECLNKAVSEVKPFNEYLPGWFEKLPKEYKVTQQLMANPTLPASLKLLENLKDKIISKSELVELLRRVDGELGYSAKPFDYFSEWNLPIFLKGKNNKNLKGIIADFREQYSNEKDRLFCALADRVFIDREGLLRWARLKRNENEEFEGNKLILPLFWGNPWDGQPKCWNPDIDDSKGLTLSVAIEQYSDSDWWIPMAVKLNSFNENNSGNKFSYPSRFLADNIEEYINTSSLKHFHGVVQAQKIQLGKYKEIWDRIVADFLENIDKGRLVMKAFVSTSNKRERISISLEEIEGILDSNGFDFINSSAQLAGVKYEGITITNSFYGLLSLITLLFYK